MLAISYAFFWYLIILIIILVILRKNGYDLAHWFNYTILHVWHCPRHAFVFFLIFSQPQTCFIWPGWMCLAKWLLPICSIFTYRPPSVCALDPISISTSIFIRQSRGSAYFDEVVCINMSLGASCDDKRQWGIQMLCAQLFGATFGHVAHPQPFSSYPTPFLLLPAFLICPLLGLKPID